MEWCNSFLENHLDKDWLFTSPLSRDVLKSPLFHHLVCLEALKELSGELRDRDITLIVEHESIKALIISFAQKEGFLLRVKCKKRLKTFLWPLFLWRSWFNCFFHWLGVRCLCTKASLPPAALTLVDTFIHPGHTKDRYYDGLWLFFKEKKMDGNAFYVPTITYTPWKELPKTLLDIQKREENFLMRYHHLTLWDIFSAGFSTAKTLTKKAPTMSFREIYMPPILHEELRNPLFFSSTLEAFLIHRFCHRLKQQGVQIERSLDWSENQVIDKAWNLGISEAFPNAKRYGYQGMLVSNMFLEKFPLDAEVKSGALPHKLLAVGPKPAEELKEFSSLQEVGVAPAFRFKSLFTCPSNSHPDYGKILIALPLTEDEARLIMDIVAGATREDPSLKWRLRLHPLHRPQLAQEFSYRTPELEISTKDVLQDLSEAKCLLSSASSMGFEALAQGVPVLVAQTFRGLDLTPFPPELKGRGWATVSDSNSLIGAIRELQNLNRKGLKEVVMKGYFSDLTPEKFESFIT